MNSFRNHLIKTFDLEHDVVANLNADIQLQHSDEHEPFAEIVTDNKGHTTLRVGKIQPSKRPIVKIR